ncbi:hypothetical protein [Methylobacterium sp. V23]|uniref:hypothetical protein n=1 Tax=Methylobacterium sp. V23 TaxID=2044878 RepID=UPI0011B0B1B7|nr:hypothetical protein [Methylobacterium sp. V23]
MIEDAELKYMRAEILDRRHQNGACQAFISSDFSNGTVGDEEVLTRILISPFHVDRKKGIMTKSAITAAETSGWSVLREQQATDLEIKTTAEGLVERARSSKQPNVGVYGVAKFTCKTIRDFLYIDDVSGSYCVYDTALKESRSHAEIFQRVFLTEKEVLSDRRKYMTAALNDIGIEPVSSYRGGLLSYLSPA